MAWSEILRPERRQPVLAGPIPEGERNATMTRIAGSLRRHGAGEVEILAALRASNAARCIPPLDDNELASIASSVARYAPEPEPPRILTSGGDGADVRPNGHGRRVAGKLRLFTAAELAAITLPAPDWLAPGLVAIQAITEVDGKIKASGKTTFLLEMARSILDGEPFLNQPTRRARILYVTEQQRQSFSDALRRARLHDRHDELGILFREDLRDKSWADVVAAIEHLAIVDRYEMVVVDTIGKLAGIVEENHAGEWSAAMSPLQDLAATGRAVVMARHDRKGGGEVGDSGRGSSQASGDVDIILALRRPEGNQPGSRRVIEALSRYPETPERMVIELGADGYRFLGSHEAVATSDARLVVLSALESEFRQVGAKQGDLVELASGQGVKRWAVISAIEQLVAEGAVVTSGTPRSPKNPLRYHLGRLVGTPDNKNRQVSEAEFEHLVKTIGGTEVQL